MPYFVKVGYDKKNVHSVTSKGYFIKRSGNHIYTEWGAIDVIGLKRKKFSWHLSTYSKPYPFKTTEEALEFKNNKIAQLIKEGYNKLPSTSIIYKQKLK